MLILFTRVRTRKLLKSLLVPYIGYGIKHKQYITDFKFYTRPASITIHQDNFDKRNLPAIRGLKYLCACLYYTANEM